MYDSIQELGVVFGNEKERYLSITPLIYSAILKKFFTVSKKLINADQKYRLFHVIFFEVKGQLVSDQFIETLILKNFNDNYNRFIKEISENITPVKLKDKSLTKSEIKAQLLETRFLKINKENQPLSGNTYQTNKVLFGKLTRP